MQAARNTTCSMPTVPLIIQMKLPGLFSEGKGGGVDLAWWSRRPWWWWRRWAATATSVLSNDN